MSGVLAIAEPRRIKAAHRRRWKVATGHRPYAYNNPYSFTDPDGRSGEFVALRGFIAFVAADAATPDPSDAAAPGKAAVYGSAIAGLAIGGGIMWVYNKATEGQSDEGGGDASPSGRGVRPPNATVDLEEDLAVGEIVGDLEAGGGEDISEGMGDPRYNPETGTQDKVRGSHSHPDGTVTEVHADRDRRTGTLTDVKIKDPPDNQRSRGR